MRKEVSCSKTIKSLKELPVFGREQTEEHVKKSGKHTILSSNKGVPQLQKL